LKVGSQKNGGTVFFERSELIFLTPIKPTFGIIVVPKKVWAPPFILSPYATVGRRIQFKGLKRLIETFKLYSATRCYSDVCLIIGLWLCQMESTSNQELVANSNIAGG